MDSNGYYYTLSTIAQTLAGAFGFLVAVVLYRMQIVREKLAIAQGRYRPYLHQIPDLNSIDPVRKAELDRLENAVKAEEGKLRMLQRDILSSLLPTAVTIGWCILALPWGHFLTNCGGPLYYAACGILLAPIVSAIVCLWKYCRLARSVTSDQQAA